MTAPGLEVRDHRPLHVLIDLGREVDLRPAALLRQLPNTLPDQAEHLAGAVGEVVTVRADGEQLRYVPAELVDRALATTGR